MELDIHPPVEREKMDQIFTSIAKSIHKIRDNLRQQYRNFPIRGIEGYIAIFILYNWTTNEILAAPIKDTKDEIIIEGFFQTHIKYIANKWFKHGFNIIDNVAWKTIKGCLQEENI